MPQTYFTVGPSQIYPTYVQHLQTAMNLNLGSIGHRTSTFRKIYQHTAEQLRLLLNIPASHAIFFYTFRNRNLGKDFTEYRKMQFLSFRQWSILATLL